MAKQTLSFPCGLSELDVNEMTEADMEALVCYHGWHRVDDEWVHDDRPGYGYASADEVVDDWSLWQIPDDITIPSAPRV